MSAHFAAMLKGLACRTISGPGSCRIRASATYNIADIGTFDEQAANEGPMLINCLLGPALGASILLELPLQIA